MGAIAHFDGTQV